MLSQAKKKIPLLLPGFESIEMSEEFSGPFSDMVNIPNIRGKCGKNPEAGISWELFSRE